ncbi:hypothetical protein CLF_110937 [Clonorchis sinensis]|uniref:Uncharacterized protein n=1 Tax=Clonorchis sinensis TaxID=79923 RepID=G7YU28_CLOSI|nr:hypothetical protein CLF_110937 [Clonorchis sinensis]
MAYHAAMFHTGHSEAKLSSPIFRLVKKGTHTVFREYDYVVLTNHNRISFLSSIRKSYQSFRHQGSVGTQTVITEPLSPSLDHPSDGMFETEKFKQAISDLCADQGCASPSQYLVCSCALRFFKEPIVNIYHFFKALIGERTLWTETVRIQTPQFCGDMLAMFLTSILKPVYDMHPLDRLDGKPFNESVPTGPSTRTSEFVRFVSTFGATSVRTSSVPNLDTSKRVFEPRKPVYLSAFNFHPLTQAEQQAVRVHTLDYNCIGVCCLSETRIRDAIIIVDLIATSLSRFRLRTSVAADINACTRSISVTGTGFQKLGAQVVTGEDPVDTQYTGLDRICVDD